MTSYPHLGTAGLEFIEQPAEERMLKIRTRRFTDYPRCSSVLQMMSEQIRQPKGMSKANLLVWGEPGQGKTTIIRKHMRAHPPVFDPRQGIRRTPAVAIEMPPAIRLPWFYRSLLSAINAPTEYRGVEAYFEIVRDHYRAMEVGQIIIDEAHNMLRGSATQQRTMLAAIRHLSNQLEIPIVLFGTQDARQALLHDPQLTRRFRLVELPHWQADEDFQGLIGDIVASFPLRRPSAFSVRSLNALLRHAKGNTGGIFDAMKELGSRAIETGEERITPDAIIDYVHVSAAG